MDATAEVLPIPQQKTQEAKKEQAVEVHAKQIETLHPDVRQITHGALIDNERRQEVENEIKQLAENGVQLEQLSRIRGLGKLIDAGMVLNEWLVGSEYNEKVKLMRAGAVVVIPLLNKYVLDSAFHNDLLHMSVDVANLVESVMIGTDALPPIEKAQKHTRKNAYEKEIESIQHGKDIDTTFLTKQLLAHHAIPVDRAMEWMQGTLDPEYNRDPRIRMLDDLFHARSTYLRESGQFNSPSALFMAEKQEKIKVIRDFLLSQDAAQELKGTLQYQSGQVVKGVGERVITATGIHMVGKLFQLAKLSGEVGKTTATVGDDVALQGPRVARGLAEFVKSKLG